MTINYIIKKPNYKQRCILCGKLEYLRHQIKAPKYYHYHCIRLNVCHNCIYEYVTMEEPKHIPQIQMYKYKIDKLKKG